MSTKWVPEVGKLVVRQLLGVECNDIFLAFRDEEANEQHFHGIAVMRDFLVEPYFANFQESVVTQSELIRDGRLVVRRYATDGDLRAFAKLWSTNSMTLGQWLITVKAIHKLSADEKDRLLYFAA